MPAYYRSTLGSFLLESPSSILGKLAEENARARFPLTPEAMQAWRAQLPALLTGIGTLIRARPRSTDWEILLEYPIPMVGKRIDGVLLAHDVILVIETKTGRSVTSAARQVDDYALNLACFHEYSKDRTIVPLVVSDSLTSSDQTHTDFDALIEECRFATTDNLGDVLEYICSEYVRDHLPAIDPSVWNEGRFRPVPTIIDAAIALYAGMDVFEIGHACAAQEDLQTTTNSLVDIVLSAQSKREKAICFTTGVPGAGKTLVGLNTVHRPEIKTTSLFLSGNGPLVRVIQEALIRDTLQRAKAADKRKTRKQEEITVRTFIHNVHRFADQCYRPEPRAPVQNVIVFDEAQRAWDAEENRRAKRPDVSEPAMVLEVMDKREDWAVVIALVGSGQEIHRGEAGLSEWGRALARFPRWKVYASPNVLGPEARAPFRLFENPDPHPERVLAIESLHLKISRRSIRAQGISDWVDALLDGRKQDAFAVAESMNAKPALTRSLSELRAWLNANRRGRTKSGLVSSSSAARLRVDGIEPTFDFHQRFEWEHWFLDSHECPIAPIAECDHKYCGDVRASSRLEVAATQFEIQGLELDWIGLCWGEDLTWNGSEWICRKFNNRRWNPFRGTDSRKQTYLINAYRVLLTRARQGMAIYVPQPDGSDGSRLYRELNDTAEFLLACGARPMATGDSPQFG